MGEVKYEVYDENGVRIASELTLDLALILVEGYMNKFHNDPCIALTIRKMELTCCNNKEG